MKRRQIVIIGGGFGGLTAARTLRNVREIPYDYLIIAAGSRHAYFGHDQWEPLAPGLKAIEDGSEMRRRFLLAFERAEKVRTEAERDAYLTSVIVGGGPTGVELSGALPPSRGKRCIPIFATSTRALRE